MEEKNSYLSADPETIRQIDEKMPPEEELQDLAEFFKVFGDATRLKILSVLLCSEMCVYDIATLLGMSQSAISHQLRVLKQMDLVKNRRDGKTIFYALADDHIITILNQGLNHIEEGNYSEQYRKIASSMLSFCSYKLLRQRNMSGCSYKCKHSTNIR